MTAEDTDKVRHAGSFFETIPTPDRDRPIVQSSEKILFQNFADGDVIRLTLSTLGISPKDPDKIALATIVLDDQILKDLQVYSTTTYERLKNEVAQLWQNLDAAIEKNDADTIWQTVQTMSTDLEEILQLSLLAAGSYWHDDNNTGNDNWPLPYDFIASLKALYTIFSQEENSREMRQGAKRTTGDGTNIVVGTSGLLSADDELLSNLVGQEVVADLKFYSQRVRTIEPRTSF